MRTRVSRSRVASSASRMAVVGLVALFLAVAQSCDEPTAPPSRGSLRIDLFGLPTGVTATVTLAGPEGETHAVVGAGTLDDLPTGAYRVTVGTPTDTVDDFAIAAPPTIRVRGGRTDSLRVVFSYRSGGVALSLDGLLETDSATVRLAVPGGPPIVLVAPSETRGLPAGRFPLMLDTLLRRGERFVPADSQFVDIVAGAALTPLRVRYLATTGSLDLRVSGLPAGVRPQAFVTQAVYGGDRYERIVAMDTVLRGLPSGWYYIEPLQANVGPFRWDGRRDPDVGQPAVYVTPNAVPIQRRFTYSITSGAVHLSVLGLPAGLRGAVHLTEGGITLTRAVLGDTLENVPPGRWVIEPALLAANNTLYGPGISATVDVTIGEVATATISFEPQAAPVDISIAKAVMTQAIQTDSNSVPLVAGIDAMLYVDVRADRPNGLPNIVRVRLYEGTEAIFDTTITGSTGILPTGWQDSQRYSGFRVRIPGALLRPGVSLSVLSDPDELIPDADPSNDRFPASGGPLALDIRDAPPLRLRFVPLHFASPAYNYVIEAGTAATYVEKLRAMLPIGPLEWDVRAPFTVQTPQPGPDDLDRWTTVLAELDILRVLEGGDRHYAGVLGVNYDAGIAGLAMLPGRSLAMWFHETPGIDLLSHELGHNFARRHAPGCNADGVDPAFPRADGSAGDWGYNSWRRAFIMPEDKDVMSYCAPHWISAYTTEGIIAFRDSAAAAVQAAEVLLVSGRIVNGRVHLDPAFTMSGFPTRATGGRHRIELRDSTGRVILTRAFQASALSDAAEGTELFTLAIPLRELGGRAAATLRVDADGSFAEIGAGSTGADISLLSVSRRSDGDLEIDGRAGGARALIVRDAASGRILAISKNGIVRLSGRYAELDIVASDGLRSARRRLRADLR